MRKRQIRIIACCFLLCMLVLGCNGGRETDEIAWVLTIGVDKADDDLAITYRIAVPKELAGESSKDSKHATTVVTVKAPTLAEGRNLLNATLSRAVSLSQVRLIVISEELAYAGVDDLIGPLTRFREFRGSIFVLVARGNIREIFEKNTPVLETLTSRWVENSIQSSNEAAYYPKATLHEFYQRLKSASGAPYAMYYSLNPLTGQGRPSGEKVDGEASKQYLPGDIPRNGGDPAEIVGTAVFNSSKMVGALDSEETRAFIIMQDRLDRSFLVVEDPLTQKHKINIAIRNGRKPKIEILSLGEKPVIRIDVFLEGEITAIPSGIAYEEPEYRSLLEKQVSNVIKRQLQDMLAKTQSWGADIVDFGYYSRGMFSTTQELFAYNWRKRYQFAQFDITVQTELRRSGLMQKSIPIQKE
ncbi:Ger(x)C family spore germination protein [Sporomusa aerivorans]|uniref:Ger(x)C family spore germination protein n=1 Tax=Sporomusa aerivorans TaxID=204936 RepID=UPI00352A7E2B